MNNCESCGRDMSTFPDPESSVELAIGNVCLYCAIQNEEAPETASTKPGADTSLNLGIKRNNDTKKSKL